MKYIKFICAPLSLAALSGCVSYKASEPYFRTAYLSDESRNAVKNAVTNEFRGSKRLVFVNYKAITVKNETTIVCGSFGEVPVPGQYVSPHSIYQFIGGLSEGRFVVLKLSNITNTYGATADCTHLELVVTAPDALPL